MRGRQPMMSIVVPARNEAQNIERAIGSVLAQDYPLDRFEIFVVDNLSTDETAALAGAFERVTVLFAEGTIGAVRNAGVRDASGTVIGFMDADCLAPANWLSSATELLTADPAVGLVGTVMRLEDEDCAPWVERRWIDNHRAKYPCELTTVSTISSFCFCVRREILDELGGFDPTLVTCEDAQLGYRIGERGWRMLVDRSVEVVHLGNAKTLARFFLRELWQGRDNLQNACGRRIELSEVGSLAAPLVFLALLATGIAASVLGYPGVATAALCAFAAVPVLIAVKKSPVRSAADLGAHSLVWATYLGARALSVFVKIERARR